MTPAEFREFRSELYDALAREGFTADDLDIRLQGSSARFFSGEHKALPLDADIHDNPDAQWRMNAWFGENENRPLRRPFDSMHRLGLDEEPSDYDIQISSDSMVDACRQRWEADGPTGSLVHPKYGFVDKQVFKALFPALWEWATDWTERTGRPVVPALFPGSGPPDTSSVGVTSHFRESDWHIRHDGTSPEPKAGVAGQPTPSDEMRSDSDYGVEPPETRSRADGRHDWSDPGGHWVDERQAPSDGRQPPPEPGHSTRIPDDPSEQAIGPDGRYKLSGHGNYYSIDGTTRVPPGTTFTVYAEHGSPITGSLGNLIETGGDTSRVYSRTYYPGEEIPNYTLEPPDGLDIKGSPHTVDRPTLLSDLLRPNMGNVDFAACLGYTSNKVFDVDVIYDGTTFAILREYKKPETVYDEDDDW
ncbi:putative adhesin [Mycobacterium sp. LTG2003]